MLVVLQNEDDNVYWNKNQLSDKQKLLWHQLFMNKNNFLTSNYYKIYTLLFMNFKFVAILIKYNKII